MPGTDEAEVGPYDARPWLASYPEGVPADFEVPDVPLTRLLDEAAASFPRGTALGFLGRCTSYRDLKDRADRFATALSGLGVGAGDRVALVLPNCPQFVIGLFAVLRLGAVAVPCSPLGTAGELRGQLRTSGARLVVCLDRLQPLVEQARAGSAVEHVVVTALADAAPLRTRLRARLPLPAGRRLRDELRAPLPPDAPVHRFLTLLRAATVPARHARVDPERDLAVLLWTGGTTGEPRAVALTHAQLVADAYLNRLWDVHAEPGREVVLGVLPLSHAFGLTVVLTSTVLLGGTVVLLPRFDLVALLAAVDAWRPTSLPAVPPVFAALAASPRTARHDLSSLRLCVSGATRLPDAVRERFEQVTGRVLREGYGLTEAAPSTHCTPVDAPPRPGSVGVPLPSTRCRVVDPLDAGREVPVGEVGELAVAGPQVFAGYWGGGGAGRRTPAGELLTGDLVVMEPDGWFRVVDRTSDVIITGGLNVHPTEVERVLAEVEGVAEAAVVGLPHAVRGEDVTAYVVREPGSAIAAEQVRTACRTELSAYKVPREVLFVPELPRSPVGKVLRRVLVEQAASGGPGRTVDG